MWRRARPDPAVEAAWAGFLGFAKALDRLGFDPGALHALNPRLVEAQEMGGAMQGIGNALHEEMLFDQTGTLLNATLFEYHVPTIADITPTHRPMMMLFQNAGANCG